MTLAYVFWHTPAPAERPGDPLPDHYEAAMQAFHSALARPGTATFRLERAPFQASPAYEDWYPVADWADVGVLNDEAITGARKPPHDTVAALSRTGAGGIYRLLSPGLPLSETTFAAWLDERPAAIPETAALWQRQLVLGPAPEYAVLAGSPVAGLDDAVLTTPRFVAGAGA